MFNKVKVNSPSDSISGQLNRKNLWDKATLDSFMHGTIEKLKCYNSNKYV